MNVLRLALLKLCWLLTHLKTRLKTTLIPVLNWKQCWKNVLKRQLLDEVQSICPPHVTIMQVRQGLAKGLGHAVLCAHPVVGDEPVAVYFA